MDIKEFSKQNRARSKESFPTCENWTASDWIVALVGEVGEAANFHKKFLRGDSESAAVHVRQFADELADAFAYLDLVAASYDLDLEDIVIHKWNEVSERVKSDRRLSETYPNEYRVYREGDRWCAEGPASAEFNTFGAGLTPVGALKALVGDYADGHSIGPGSIVRHGADRMAVAMLNKRGEDQSYGWYATSALGETVWLALFDKNLIPANEFDRLMWTQLEPLRAMHLADKES